MYAFTTLHFLCLFQCALLMKKIKFPVKWPQATPSDCLLETFVITGSDSFMPAAVPGDLQWDRLWRRQCCSDSWQVRSSLFLLWILHLNQSLNVKKGLIKVLFSLIVVITVYDHRMYLHGHGPCVPYATAHTQRSEDNCGASSLLSPLQSLKIEKLSGFCDKFLTHKLSHQPPDMVLFFP